MSEITNNEIRAVRMLELLTKELIEPGNMLTKDATVALDMATRIVLDIEVERAWQEHELQHPCGVSVPNTGDWA